MLQSPATITDEDIDSDDGDIVLSVENVSQWFGDKKVLYDIDLKIVRGQFVAMVGGSGCGKSTLLKAILGTQPPKEGKIAIAEHGEIIGPSRHVGIVYQKYGLYQFLTAQQNVALGPKLDKTNLWHRTLMPWYWWPLRRQQMQQSKELLERLKLGHAIQCYPNELSGGMQQRVAIAQALIMEPQILLLDEPFGALDESTRESLQTMLVMLYHENMVAMAAGRKAPWTVIIVTHELSEAFYVCDRVIALSKNWKDGAKRGADLGATKVWDKCAPVYHPEAPRDFELFADLKKQVREIALDEGAPEVDRNTHVSFWSDLKRGVGTGVALMGVTA